MPVSNALIGAMANPQVPDVAARFSQGQQNAQSLRMNEQNMRIQQQMAEREAAMHPLAMRAQQLGNMATAQTMQLNAQKEQREQQVHMLQQSAYDVAALASVSDPTQQTELLNHFAEKYKGTQFEPELKKMQLLGHAERNKAIGEGVAKMQMMGLLPMPKEVDLEVARYAEMMGVEPGTPEYQKMAAEAYAAWLQKQQKAGVEVNVDTGTEGTAGIERLQKNLVDSLVEQQGQARDAVQSLSYASDQTKLINSGIISGWGSDWLVELGKFVSRFGFDEHDDLIANTEAYMAHSAQETGRLIEMFGAGTGLSDADREFARMAAAGDINMTEDSLRRVLLINQKAAYNSIRYYNNRAKYYEGKPGVFEPLQIAVPENFAPEAWMDKTGKFDNVMDSTANLKPIKYDFPVWEGDVDPNERVFYNEETGQWLKSDGREGWALIPSYKVPRATMTRHGVNPGSTFNVQNGPQLLSPRQ